MKNGMAGFAGGHVTSDQVFPVAAVHEWSVELTSDAVQLILQPSHGNGDPPMAHLLIADDNPLSLQFFTEAIALAGHTSITAGDGIAAVTLALGHHFDLILLDARMPGHDGSEALARIRASSKLNGATPALVTTANASIDSAALLDGGFLDIVYKPVRLAELHAKLARHLPASPADGAPCLLDDGLAAEKTGGDVSIVAALRGLFAAELEALPAELDQISGRSDRAALHDRLHRLDASAGFCGATVLSQAIGELRRALDTDSRWPVAALARLAGVCMRTRIALG
jgi:CheY-like chemotaxis protein/HPt (histidine-containing phosphotransfer) domain-containing protein